MNEWETQRQWVYGFDNDLECEDIRLVDCGWQKRLADHSYGPVVFTHDVVQCMLRGKGVLRVGKKNYTLSEHDVFYLPEGSVVSYCADPADPYEYVWLGMRGNSVKAVLDRIGLSAALPVLACGELAVRERAQALFAAASQCGVTGRLETQAAAYALLSELSKIDPSNLVTTTSNASHYVRVAIDYMRYNFTKDINVEKIAAFLNLSRTYFYAVFKREIGVSPKEYLTNLRIEQACSLLKEGLAAAEVCDICGFSDASAFSVSFKKKIGLTPKQYARADMIP